ALQVIAAIAMAAATASDLKLFMRSPPFRSYFLERPWTGRPWGRSAHFITSLPQFFIEPGMTPAVCIRPFCRRFRHHPKKAEFDPGCVKTPVVSPQERIELATSAIL